MTGLERLWAFQEVEAPTFQDSRHMKVVRLSAVCTSRLHPPGNIPGTHFCQRLSHPQGHSVTGRIMSMKTSNDTIGIRTRDVWKKYRGLKFSNFIPYWKILQFSLSVTFSCPLPISQLWYDIYEICVTQRTPWFDFYCLALVTCCRTGPRYESVTHIAFVFSLFLVHKPRIELGLLRNVWLQLNSKPFQELPYLESWCLGFKELWKFGRGLL